MFHQRVSTPEGPYNMANVQELHTYGHSAAPISASFVDCRGAVLSDATGAYSSAVGSVSEWDSYACGYAAGTGHNLAYLQQASRSFVMAYPTSYGMVITQQSQIHVAESIMTPDGWVSTPGYDPYSNFAGVYSNQAMQNPEGFTSASGYDFFQSTADQAPTDPYNSSYNSQNYFSYGATYPEQTSNGAGFPQEVPSHGGYYQQTYHDQQNSYMLQGQQWETVYGAAFSQDGFVEAGYCQQYGHTSHGQQHRYTTSVSVHQPTESSRINSVPEITILDDEDEDSTWLDKATNRPALLAIEWKKDDIPEEGFAEALNEKPVNANDGLEAVDTSSNILSDIDADIIYASETSESDLSSDELCLTTTLSGEICSESCIEVMAEPINTDTALDNSFNACSDIDTVMFKLLNSKTDVLEAIDIFESISDHEAVMVEPRNPNTDVLEATDMFEATSTQDLMEQMNANTDIPKEIDIFEDINDLEDVMMEPMNIHTDILKTINVFENTNVNEARDPMNTKTDRLDGCGAALEADDIQTDIAATGSTSNPASDIDTYVTVDFKRDDCSRADSTSHQSGWRQCLRKLNAFAGAVCKEIATCYIKGLLQ